MQAEEESGPPQAFKIESFETLVVGFKPFTLVARLS